MSTNSSIAIDTAQLLEIRHLPLPATRSAPLSNSDWLGSFFSRKRGHGTDYDDLRAYSAGDDIRHIDWRVSARMQELHTRLYHEEKDHRISIICDLRACMFTGSATLRAYKAVLLATRCLWCACEGGTRVNLLLITPNGVSTMEPGSGHAAAIRGCALLSGEYQRIANALTDSARVVDDDKLHVYQHALTVERPSQGPLLGTLLQWMTQQQEHRSTLLWLTALDFTGEYFFETISSLAPPSHSVFVYIDEPVLQNGLPTGDYHYESSYESSMDALAADSVALRSTNINGVNRRSLQAKLEQQQHARAAHMSSLHIPCISTASGDTEVIAALRHQAYLP